MGSTNGQSFTPPTPRSDEELLIWVRSFSEAIERAEQGAATGIPPAAELGFTPEEAQALVALATEFGRSMEVASNIDTRSRDTIATKDFARDRAVQSVRTHKARIKADQRIPPEVKVMLGIRLSAASKPRIEAPTTAPLLHVAMGGPGFHLLRYADELTPDSKAKPHGVLHMQLYMAFGPPGSPPVTDPGDTRMVFTQNVTKTPFKVHFTAEQNAKMVTYMARWSTRTGLTGPWSQPVAMTAMGVA